MNVFMKKLMMLSAALMVGTSCFAMDAEDPGKKVTAKPTATEIKREEEAKKDSSGTTTEITPFFETLPLEVSHSILSDVATQDIEFF